MNASEHLLAWKHPSDYGGFSPEGDYLVLSRMRDSHLLEESNWSVACKTLNAQAYDGGEKHFSERPIAYHWRASHWAVGWVEYLCVRADAPDNVLQEAGEIVCSLADYPILSEEDYCEREHNAVCEYWARCRVADRVDYLRDAGLSIFAARRDYLPEDPSGALFDMLRIGL